MARIRFKIELNPGGVGVRLDKLARISSELEKFARHLAKDCGAEIDLGDWIARDFYNKSVGTVIEYVGYVDNGVVGKFNAGMRFFSSFNAKNANAISRYSDSTIQNFVDVGGVLDADERFKVGVLEDDENETEEATEWHSVSKATALAIDAAVRKEVVWEGSIQGSLGTWYKNSNYFNLIDFALGGSVKCVYAPSRYADVYALFEAKDAVVHVSGTVKSDMSTGRAREIKVRDMRSYKPLSDEEFEVLMRGKSGVGGSADTAEMIERRRGDESI